MMKRVKIKKEPVLHCHRYVVTVGRRCTPKKGKAYWHTEFHFCLNVPAVDKLRAKLPKGRYVEVFAARHDFREAWES